MFLRKLTAVGYPFSAQFNANDEKCVRNLVIWLEDNVFFTELSPDLSKELHDENHPEWSQPFSTYLSECFCPYEWNVERTACVDWLLREAVRMIFEYPESDAKKIKLDAVVRPAKNIAQNGSSAVEDCSRFAGEIGKMAAMLRIVQHPNMAFTLQAVASMISNLAPHENRQQNSSGKNRIELSLENVTLGFNIPDKRLSDACKILRLLHLHQLRSLQTEMDIALVRAQSVTADPKTDQQLGRTGF